MILITCLCGLKTLLRSQTRLHSTKCLVFWVQQLQLVFPKMEGEELSAAIEVIESTDLKGYLKKNSDEFRC